MVGPNDVDDESTGQRDDWQGDPEPATALVLTSRSELGAADACAHRLTAADPAEENVLVVTYTQLVDDVLDRWRDVSGAMPAAFGLISFAESTRSAARSPSTPTSLPGSNVTLTAMNDPGDLQGLGTAITLYLDDWADDGRRTVVCVDSLTPMLRERGTEQVFQFLHVLTGYVKRADACVHVHLDPTRHDDRTIKTLEPLFDDVCGSETDAGAERSSAADVERDVVRNPRRRYILAYLYDHENPVGLRALAAGVAATENDAEVDDLTSLECDRVYTALAASHLPQLQNAGLVEFDTDGKEVTLSPAARRNRRLRQYVEEFSE
ncbi:DUF7504 family protein [Salinirarus marinus]|uniref:DUF7504 family protein n=1 Tax=Salinirarus marinus TaxID=3068310 RepID=UPI003C6BD979